MRQRCSMQDVAIDTDLEDPVQVAQRHEDQGSDARVPENKLCLAKVSRLKGEQTTAFRTNRFSE